MRRLQFGPTLIGCVDDATYKEPIGIQGVVRLDLEQFPSAKPFPSPLIQESTIQ